VPTLSDVPTIVEAGYPSLVVEDWTGFAVKHGTPKEMHRLASNAMETERLTVERDVARVVDDLVAATRKTYSGPLEVGEDLLSFEVGETVVVRRT
jgi:tripartite-type tricarboxylate transporter receptor subunit TctC